VGFDVLLFDYRGYGRSSGKASEHGTYGDARAALTCLLRQPHVDVSPLARRSAAPWRSISRSSTLRPGWSCCRRSSPAGDGAHALRPIAAQLAPASPNLRRIRDLASQRTAQTLIDERSADDRA
jgi:hypothetical protein